MADKDPGCSTSPLPFSVPTINSPEGTGQLSELPLCCHTSGNGPKHSWKGTRNKRCKAWHFSKELCSGTALSHWMWQLKKKKKKEESLSALCLRRQNLPCCQCLTDPTLPPSQSIHLTELAVYRRKENHNIRSAPGADRRYLPNTKPLLSADWWLGIFFLFV